MIELNYWAILVASVLSMVLGAIWYGPLFGKKWMEIVGADANDIMARKKMQKEAGKLYVVQFILTLFQTWVLAIYIQSALSDIGGIENAIWIWAAFVMPTIAGSAMWNNDSSKISWARFLIQGGYQLVLFIMFGLILTWWA